MTDRHPGGRPTIYSKELAEAICERIVENMTVAAIADLEGYPAASTIWSWLNAKPEFLELYTRAKETQALRDEDEIKEIADDGRNDWMERLDKDGGVAGWSLNGEAVARSRLRVEARLKLMPLKNQRRFGNKVDLNVAGSLQTNHDAPAIASRVAEILALADARKNADSAGD